MYKNVNLKVSLGLSSHNRMASIIPARNRANPVATTCFHDLTVAPKHATGLGFGV